MKKELEDVEKYKDYPEGSGMKRQYDSVFLPFSDYLNKYYSNVDLSSWNLWQKKYIEPAFEKERRKEMIKNFGYSSIENHDFEVQEKVYKQLKNDIRLDDETKRFIGFLAGTNFFKTYDFTVKKWFNMKNWSSPKLELEGGKSLNEILDYPFGIKMIKSGLPQLPYWKRS